MAPTSPLDTSHKVATVPIILQKDATEILLEILLFINNDLFYSSALVQAQYIRGRVLLKGVFR